MLFSTGVIVNGEMRLKANFFGLPGDAMAGTEDQRPNKPDLRYLVRNTAAGLHPDQHIRSIFPVQYQHTRRAVEVSASG